MAEDWVTYPMEDEGTLRLVGINLAWAEQAPDRTRPLCTLVRIPFHAPEENRLGTTQERDRIGDIEDALAERIERESGAAHVLSIRGDGAIEFWAYSNPGAQTAIHAAARELFKEWNVEMTSKPDPSWKMYTNLLPDAATMREIGDLQLVQLLESKGDTLTTPRAVEHFIFFPSRPAAEEFATQAQTYGFEVRIQDAEDDRPVTAIASREDPVDLESIHEITTLLTDLADEHRGEYDGWETRVVTE